MLIVTVLMSVFSYAPIYGRGITDATLEQTCAISTWTYDHSTGADCYLVQGHEIGEAFGCGRWTGESKHWAIENQTEPPTWIALAGGASLSQQLEAARCPKIAEPEFCEAWEYCDDQIGTCVAYNTPILIPLTRSQAFKLTSFAQGVTFDHRGDGFAEQTGWTAGDSKLAFLAMDRNGNGKIDNGTELFGNHTVKGANTGFEALSTLNEQMGGGKVGVIDSDQPIFSKLLLWEDRNHNGISESAELQPASSLVSGIGVGLEFHRRKDGNGNLFAYRGFAHVRTAPGKNDVKSGADDRERQINIFDVVLASR